MEALLDVLGPFIGDQPVHSGIWEGWSWLHDTGSDPPAAPGMRAYVYWDENDRPKQVEIENGLAAAREELATVRVALPDCDPLELPERRYYPWTGPRKSATRIPPPAPTTLLR